MYPAIQSNPSVVPTAPSNSPAHPTKPAYPTLLLYALRLHLLSAVCTDLIWWTVSQDSHRGNALAGRLTRIKEYIKKQNKSRKYHNSKGK